MKKIREFRMEEPFNEAKISESIKHLKASSRNKDKMEEDDDLRKARNNARYEGCQTNYRED